MKRKMLKKGLIIIIISMCILLSIAIIMIYNDVKVKLKEVKIISIEDKMFDINIEVETKMLQKAYCSVVSLENISEQIEYVEAKDNICTFENLKTEEDYYIYLKNNNNTSNYRLQNYIDGNIIDIDTDQNKIYLLKGESTYINYRLNTLVKSIDENVIIKSENETILKVQDTKITGIKVGNTNVILEANGIIKKIPVVVTDLIKKPKLNNNKSFLTCNRYTKEEAALLDELLAYRIKQAGGYQTRGAVVAAVRFLLLEFPYRINYFPENGRLTSTNPSRVIDGEGRYYHKGLYLSEDKFYSISSSNTGPAIWGCPLKISYGEKDQPAGSYYPNGFDCSGLISWVLLNGGYDVGDIGAGFSSVKDLSDLGVKQSITTSLLNSGKVKAGDLIGVDGHIAIIIGIDEKNKKVYTAETLFYNVGTIVKTYTYNSLAATNYYTYIIQMDSYYQSEGNYKNMW